MSVEESLFAARLAFAVARDNKTVDLLDSDVGEGYDADDKRDGARLLFSNSNNDRRFLVTITETTAHTMSDISPCPECGVEAGEPCR